MLIKLYLHDDGRLLYSRNWPTVPEVQVSVNRDQMMLNTYQRELEYLCDPHRAIVVANPEFALGHVRHQVGQFFEIDCGYHIDGEAKTITLTKP